MAVNTNINIPQSPFLDALTNRPAREWLVWLQYPKVVAINLANALDVSSGGTGSNAIPTNGQTLIGNGVGYVAANITPDVGIDITNGAGSITVKNTGVLSFSTGTTGLTPSIATAGNVVLAGTLQVANGGTGLISIPAGRLLFGNTATQTSYDSDLLWNTASKDLQINTSSSGVKRSFSAISSSASISFGIDTTNIGFLSSLNDLVISTNGTERLKITSAGAYYWNGTLGASGTFKSADLPQKTITVSNGVITSIV